MRALDHIANLISQEKSDYGRSVQIVVMEDSVVIVVNVRDAASS